MSAQLRYRTLVHNIGRVYSSQPEGRTQLLQTGLDEICTVLAPTTPAQWDLVGTDSERLLRVWVAKESDPAASEVATQLVDILYELAASAPAHAVSLAAPTPAPTAATPDSPTLVVVDTITHVHPMRVCIDDDDGVKVVSVGLPCDVEEEAEEEAEEEEEEEAAEEEAEEEEEEEAAEEEEEEAAEEEEEEAAEEEVEEEAEEEAEVVEPEEEEEAAEEEEEGMEVEKIFVRGRAYWLDSTTKKLYAVIDEDDVGDEVGALVGGKPQFLAK